MILVSALLHSVLMGPMPTLNVLTGLGVIYFCMVMEPVAQGLVMGVASKPYIYTSHINYGFVVVVIR
jgi:hypothetical protein